MQAVSLYKSRESSVMQEFIHIYLEFRRYGYLHVSRHLGTVGKKIIKSRIDSGVRQGCPLATKILPFRMLYNIPAGSVAPRIHFMHLNETAVLCTITLRRLQFPSRCQIKSRSHTRRYDKRNRY